MLIIFFREEYEWMDFQKFVHYFRTKHNEVVKENEVHDY